jgi:hypothetical protein
MLRPTKKTSGEAPAQAQELPEYMIEALDRAIPPSQTDEEEPLPDYMAKALDNALAPSVTEQLDETPEIGGVDSTPAFDPATKDQEVAYINEEVDAQLMPIEKDDKITFGSGLSFDNELISSAPDEVVSKYGRRRLRRLDGIKRAFGFYEDERRKQEGGGLSDVFLTKSDLGRVIKDVDLDSLSEDDYRLLQTVAENAANRDLARAASDYFTGVEAGLLFGEEVPAMSPGSRKNLVAHAVAADPNFAAIHKAGQDVSYAATMDDDDMYIMDKLQREVSEMGEFPARIAKSHAHKAFMRGVERKNYIGYDQIPQLIDGQIGTSMKDNVEAASDLFPDIEDNAGGRNGYAIESLADKFSELGPEQVNKLYLSMLIDEWNQKAGSVMPGLDRPRKEDGSQPDGWLIDDIEDAILSIPAQLGRLTPTQKRFFEVDAQIKALYPVVEFGVLPSKAQETGRGFLAGARRGMGRSLSSFYGAADPSTPETQQALETALSASGTMPDIDQDAFDEERKGAESKQSLTNPEAWGELVGVMGAIGATMTGYGGNAMGLRATKAAQSIPRLGRLLKGAKTARGKAFQNVANQVISGAVSYEISGEINRNLGDELNAGSGAVGGLASGVFAQLWSKVLPKVAITVGDKIKKAAVRKAGAGFAEQAEETFQTAYQEISKQGDFKEAYRALSQEGGPLSGLSEAGFFFVSSFLMGAVMGGGADANADTQLPELLARFAETLPESDRAIIEGIMDDAVRPEIESDAQESQPDPASPERAQGQTETATEVEPQSQEEVVVEGADTQNIESTTTESTEATPQEAAAPGLQVEEIQDTPLQEGEKTEIAESTGKSEVNSSQESTTTVDEPSAIEPQVESVPQPEVVDGPGLPPSRVDTNAVDESNVEQAVAESGIDATPGWQIVVNDEGQVTAAKREAPTGDVFYIVDGDRNMYRVRNGKRARKPIGKKGPFYKTVMKAEQAFQNSDGRVDEALREQVDTQELGKMDMSISGGRLNMDMEEIPADFMPGLSDEARYVAFYATDQDGNLDQQAATEMVNDLRTRLAALPKAVSEQASDMQARLFDALDEVSAAQDAQIQSNQNTQEASSVEADISADAGGDAEVNTPQDTLEDMFPGIRAQAERLGVTEQLAVMEEAITSGKPVSRNPIFSRPRFQQAISRRGPIAKAYQQYRKQVSQSTGRATGKDRATEFVAINQRAQEQTGDRADSILQEAVESNKSESRAASRSVDTTLRDMAMTDELSSASNTEIQSVVDEAIFRAGLKPVLDALIARLTPIIGDGAQVFGMDADALAKRLAERALLGLSPLGENSRVEPAGKTIAAAINEELAVAERKSAEQQAGDIFFSANAVVPGAPTAAGGVMPSPSESLVPSEPIMGERPRLRRDTLAEVVKKLGLAVRRKGKRLNDKRRQKAFGWYRPSLGGVVMKSLEDLLTLAHEIGHALDDRHNIVQGLIGSGSANAMMHEIDALSSLQPPAPAGANALEYKTQEALAELIRHLVIAPVATAQAFPLMTAVLNSVTTAKEKSALDILSRDHRIIMGADPISRAAANIEATGVDEGTIRDMENRGAFRSFIDRLNINWLDAMYPVWKSLKMAMSAEQLGSLVPSANPRIALSRFLGFSSVFEEMMDRGIESAPGQVAIDNQVPDSWVDKQLAAMQRAGKNITRAALKNRAINFQYIAEVAPSGSPESIKRFLDDLAAYMIAQRVVALVESGRFSSTDTISGYSIDGETDYEGAQKVIAAFEAKRTQPGGKDYVERLEEGARRYRVYADTLLDYLVADGRLKAENVQEIRDQNLQYVAMQRLMEGAGGDLTKPGDIVGRPTSILLDVKDLVKEIKGSSRAIRNPYTALVMSTHKVYKEAIRNNFLRTYMNAVTTNGAVMEGDVVIARDVTEFVESTTDENGVEVAKLLTAPEVQSSNKTEIVTVYEQGVPKFYEIDADIHKAMQEMYSVAPIGKKLEWLTYFARIVRFTVTHFPTFAIRSLVRDTQARLMGVTSTKLGDQGLVTVMRGSGNVKNLRESFRALNRFGGGQAGHHMASPVDFYALIDDSIDKLSDRKTIIGLPSRKTGAIEVMTKNRIAKGYKELLVASENLNRVQEYRNALRATQEKVDKGEWSEYDQEIYAAHQGRKLLDFAVGGKHSMLANRIIPFFNASIQGTVRTFSALRDNPAAFTARFLLFGVGPALLMRMLRDDDENEDLDDAAGYRRDLFWNVKVGDSWLSIPRPYEVGAFIGAAERMVSRLEGNENAFDGYAGSLASATIPISGKVMLNNTAPVIAELLTNYSSFYDRNIVPPWEVELARKYRNTERASRLGKAVEALSWHTVETIADEYAADKKFWDARQVDYALSQTFTYFGDFSMRMSNIGRDRSETQRVIQDPSVTGLFRGPITGEAQPVVGLDAYARTYKLTRDVSYNNVRALRSRYYNSLEAKDPEADKYRREWIDAARETLKYYKDNDIQNRRDANE